MIKQEFKIEIDASRHKVWDTMLKPETYTQWVNESWPGSFYVGNWKKGESIRFLSKSGEGTLATIKELRPNEFILAKHVAVILRDGSEDRESDIAKGWIGTTESYTFLERNNRTEVKVEIHTNPEWEKMFSDGWPKALLKLKEIAER